MAKIAVDIDSTLYDFEGVAREAMLKLYQDTKDPAYMRGAYHPWTEWRSPADAMTGDDNKITRWLNAIDVCHQPDVILSRTPFDGSVETCNELVHEGHELLYISNRAEEAADPTYEWLEESGFLVPGSTEVVCTTGDKGPFMADCQYIIDDRLKTVVQFVHDFEWQFKHGPRGTNPAMERKAFVLGYEYNQAGTDIPGLYVAMTWAGLNEYLQLKGLLTRNVYRALEGVA